MRVNDIEMQHMRIFRLVDRSYEKFAGKDRNLKTNLMLAQSRYDSAS